MSVATITLHDDGQAVACNLVFTNGFNRASRAHQAAQALIRHMDERMQRQGAAVIDQVETDQVARLGEPTDGERAVAAIMELKTRADARAPNVTLCEQCYPAWGEHEVLTIVPMTPCAECGQYDQQHTGGVPAHLFRGDPRAARADRQAATDVMAEAQRAMDAAPQHMEES